MQIQNKRAVSTLVLILLIMISAIVGGLITYMFTIAFFTEIPKGTTIAITGVFFDRENASSFKISVLNPSYSSTNATISGLAISTQATLQLYNISETQPVIGNGIVLQKGESLNITCSKVLREGNNVTWGAISGEFAGQNITVYVFSPDASAANMEVTMPSVKLSFTRTSFDPKLSFRRFNVTLLNPAESEINLTVKAISVSGVEELKENDTIPKLPKSIAVNESITFLCSVNWHGLKNTTLTIFTKEGYLFSKSIGLQEIYTGIQNVTFNEDYTDHFNVTVANSLESANYVNVTKITCTLENGTLEEREYSSVGIAPNTTAVFMFNWTWKEYREKSANITAYLLQDFETDAYVTTTPKPIILKVMNEKEVFVLSDHDHFNIALQYHPSSLKAINITKIVSKEPFGLTQVITGSNSSPTLPYGPIQPEEYTEFYCNITDWTRNAGLNLTLTVYAIINETSEEHTFDFVFTLPGAELNITLPIISTTIGESKYLNITVENPYYSVWNLTISKVIVKLGNQSLEQTFAQNQTIVKTGGVASLLYAFKWDEHLGESINIAVTTVEGVEDSIEWTVTAPP